MLIRSILTLLLLATLIVLMTVASAAYSPSLAISLPTASQMVARSVASAPSPAPASAVAQPEADPPISKADRDLLVLNVFNEARGDTPEGMRAILAVTMARTESQCFPDTIREVIYQPRQFSWTHQRGTARTLAAAKAREPLALAKVCAVVDEFIGDGAPAGDELLYHAHSVRPVWAGSSQLKRSRVLRHHVFYQHKNC
ncbi:cell wall hydrolase [Chitinilyticum piscinae]|uniref:Cell wall hydrolase n=1 Tax=Chitinilyticum piscinae TaxID=2866724 RepID=A0A8J7FFR4_9NEIS|nr:cell wall hydrolase [Chitinilyticum piscinae]MBE9608200.1 cell wall hydrolase [Chitinilyticum piscinae]